MESLMNTLNRDRSNDLLDKIEAAIEQSNRQRRDVGVMDGGCSFPKEFEIRFASTGDKRMTGLNNVNGLTEWLNSLNGKVAP